LEQRLRHQANEQGLGLDAVLMLAVDSPEWGQRLVALVRPASPLVNASAWPELQRCLQAITATWLPSERPLQWCHCPELAPSEAGKWERERWQRWYASVDRD